MKKITYLLIIVALAACQFSEKEKEEKNQLPLADEQFEAYKKEFIDSLWIMNPIWASFEGFHEYSNQLPIPTKASEKNLLAFAARKMAALKAIDLESLSEENLIDYYLIRDYLESQRFYINDFQSEVWNPASYNIGGAFYQVINYRESSLEDRLQVLFAKLELVPDYYETAQKRISNPTEVHTHLAIQQIKGSISIFTENLMDSLSQSRHADDFKLRFEERVQAAVEAIENFVSFLENEVLVKAESNGKSFRIGEKQFEQKFKYQIQSNYTAKEIFDAAVEAKSDLHDKMFGLSEDLWEKYFGTQEKPGSRLTQIKMVIDEVSKQHVHRDSFVIAIRQQIPQLVAFVKENDLLTLDPKKPLVVRETPKYMRGFAGASISAPGPYDKNAETYYNVTPLDHYSTEEAESYLREYNDYVLQILNIHEAIPGHYTQLVYSNQSPSLIKSILGNGAMIEGWAVYAERMMLEAGYGGDALEMGLMYYKWNLRTVCNTILDYGIHVLDYSEEDAMHLLMREAFQEMAEAKGKWRRACLSQVQLCSYFTGFYEIMQLREELKELQGADFDLKQFHEQFLSYGSAPVKYIRQLMLKDLNVKQNESKKAA